MAARTQASPVNCAHQTILQRLQQRIADKEWMSEDWEWECLLLQAMWLLLATSDHITTISYI